MKEFIKTDRKQKHRRPVVSGILTGLVNGFFGSGGGMIAVQAMERDGLESRQAHATSILTILPLSVISAYVYFSKGNLSFSADHWALLAGSSAGGILGAMLLGRLSAKWIDLLFTILMLISGIRMVFS